MRSLASATGGSADNAVGTTAKTGIVPDESSPGTRFPLQPRQGYPRSPTATRLGPPSTPTVSTGWSRTSAGEPSPVAMASLPPEIQSTTPPAQPRVSFGTRPSTGTQSRAEAGSESSRSKTPPPPPLLVPPPIQERDSPSPSQPPMTGIHPPTLRQKRLRQLHENCFPHTLSRRRSRRKRC